MVRVRAGDIPPLPPFTREVLDHYFSAARTEAALPELEPQADPRPILFTVEEAADLLRIGRRRLVERTAVDTYIAHQRESRRDHAG